MDIAQFNKKLGTEITKAKSYERNNNKEEAIKAWLKVSEITLQASKASGLDFSFKNMLIRKTEEIIAHIKNLKGADKSILTPEIPSQIDIIQEQPQTIEANSIPIATETSSATKNETIISKSTNNFKAKIIEDVEFKKIPKGFKEIEAPKEFKILTPHDPNYIKNIIKEDINIDIIKNTEINAEEKKIKPAQNNLDISQPKIELEDLSKTGQVICFACGNDQNPPNVTVCKNCGTKLK